MSSNDDETLMSSNEDDDNDDNNDDETMDQNKKIKYLSDILDERIDKSKSFEKQIKSLDKLKGLKGYWSYNNFGDKELIYKYFKTELADISSEIVKKFFKQIFGHTLETLANKLMNTTNKEGNQIIVKNINKNK